MGADIHLFMERQNNDGSYSLIGELEIIRDYSIFGFLADVRNYSAIQPISNCRGIPTNISTEMKNAIDDEMFDCHSFSWLYLEELKNYDYDQIIEDRRCANGETCDPGKGEKMPLREFLGFEYFENLETMEKLDTTRIIFWFDN